MSRTLRISRIHRPVTALGPGRRIGLWVSGCSLGCSGCIATDTWPADSGSAGTVAEVADQLAAGFADDASLTGLTVSGGEPLEQADAVRELLLDLRGRLGRVPGRGAGSAGEVDVLLYTGWSRGRVQRDSAWVWESVDACIPEPFVAARAPGGTWRGSDNQPLLLLTDLARQRYADTEQRAPAIQVSVVDGRLWTIGVPRPGDMDRMLELARRRGLAVGRVSWHA